MAYVGKRGRRQTAGEDYLVTEPEKYETGVGKAPVIDGVKTKRLRLVPDERGWLMEILRSDDPEFFIRFGQKSWYFVIFRNLCVLTTEKIFIFEKNENFPL